MKTEKIVWGMVLIFIGSIILLQNFNMIDFYWSSIWRFWPVIFILIGANMLFSRVVNHRASPYIIGTITFIILGLVAYQGTRLDSSSGWFSYNFENDSADTSSNVVVISSSIAETYDGSKNASLYIQGGATRFKLTDTTSNLFKASGSGDQQLEKFTLSKTLVDSTEVLNFKMRKGKQKWNLEEMDDNETFFQMNDKPIWDVKIEMGAGEAIFDFSNYKVKKLVFEGGAATFEAKIGSKLPFTEVEVKAGLANIEIEVPKASACRIVVESGLSSKDFIGFIKQADGSYQTSNYSSAPNKITINLQGGLASFEVKKY